MQIHPLILAAALTSTLAACSASSEPQLEIYRGTMQSGCAPHDAPSTTFRLESEATGDFVSLNLWPSGGVSLPSTIEFDAGRTVGQGAYCTGTDECEQAMWGRISLEPSTGAASVRGEWTLGLADGRTVSGSFTADWLAIQALCG